MHFLAHNLINVWFLEGSFVNKINTGIFLAIWDNISWFYLCWTCFTYILLFQIERDAKGSVQCRPHPGPFSEKSKPFQHSYFMGLRRSKASSQESNTFDMNMTIEEFKHELYMYSLWKPTMWIQVCHVKRQDIPTFVFPGGVRPAKKRRCSLKRPLETTTTTTIMNMKKMKKDEERWRQYWTY